MITHQYNLNKGTLLDTHGNTTVESNTSFDRKEKGLALYCNGTDAKFELGDIGNVRCLVFWVNLKSTTEQIFEGDPNTHLIHANAGTLTYPDFDNAFVDGVDTNTITTGWHLVVVTSTTDVECSDAILGLNNATYGNLWCSKIIVCDHELTSKEIAIEMSSFLSASPIQRAVEDNLAYEALKPHDLSHAPNLVAAYNFIEGGNNTDISGNGNNDLSTGKLPLTKDGKYYYVDGKSVIGNVGNIKSIAFRIN